MRCRRVVIVTPGFNGRDGISAVARQFAAALGGPIPGGSELEIWSLDDAGPPVGLPPDVTFRGAAGRRLAFASLALRPRRSPAESLIVVTHVHLLPVVLPLLYRGARVVPVLEGVESWKPLRALEHRALARAYRVLAISQHTVARFKQANPSFADLAVSVCHPSVPEGTPAAPERIPGRFALIVGRMAAEERYKGHDLLLQIWPRVRQAVADAELLVVGDGDDRPRLEARARDLGLADAVRFAGSIGESQLAACYRDARVFVMPSRDEGFGLVFLEAMGAGTPCIAGRGAAEEIIRHQADGFVVSPDDGDALVAALVRIFADEPLRARMGASARMRVKDRFTAAHFADRVNQALDLGTVAVPC